MTRVTKIPSIAIITWMISQDGQDWSPETRQPLPYGFSWSEALPIFSDVFLLLLWCGQRWKLCFVQCPLHHLSICCNVQSCPYFCVPAWHVLAFNANCGKKKTSHVAESANARCLAENKASIDGICLLSVFDLVSWNCSGSRGNDKYSVSFAKEYFHIYTYIYIYI